jgi:HSP20 family molecular chaperone IbpA
LAAIVTHTRACRDQLLDPPLHSAAAVAKRFDGLFRGFGEVLQIAGDLADRAHTDGVCDVTVRLDGGPLITGLGALRAGPQRERPGARGTVADVFDEGNYYLVIVQLPGARESSVQWAVRREGRVEVRAEADGRTYYKDIALGGPVQEESATSRYGNGVLELRLCKQQSR